MNISPLLLLASVGIISALLALYLFRRIRLRYPQQWAKNLLPQTNPDRRRRIPWNALLELLAIALWAAWVGREYLDLNPTIWPSGGEFAMSNYEFGMAIQPHYVWTSLAKCGTCMLWNGSVNGGSPAFADLYGATLHPLIIFTTLIFGAVNGAKLVIVASLVMAGIAQWWLARVMELGRTARVWSAAMAVVGGHLAGRMEIGVITMVLSTAACSLTLAPGLKLARTNSRRAAILFGIMVGLALLSGQGYLQVGLAVAIMPAFVLLLIDRRPHLHLRPAWKKFLLAGLIAVLVAAIWWVPVIHFSPNFQKEADPNFLSAQPIQYAILNLVINNPRFYADTTLGKLSVPYLYINYIGWVPILLAILAIWLINRSARRLLLFFWIAIGLIYLGSSAITFKLLAIPFPDLAAGIDYPSVIAGLAVPLILGLAACGLDRFLHLNWWRAAPLVWQKIAAALLIAVVLMGALQSAYEFGQNWLTTALIPDRFYSLVEMIKPQTVQWVSLPFGYHFWTPIALDSGLKLTDVAEPWSWKNRTNPPAYLEAAYTLANHSQTNTTLLPAPEGLDLIAHSSNEYAFIDTGSHSIVCGVQALGGKIDIDCNTDTAGTLIVHENNWDGWYVNRDGLSADLGTGQWLSTAAPAGDHHYEFRYRPWDVPLGLAVSLIGLGLAAWLWIRAPEKTSRIEIDEQQPAA